MNTIQQADIDAQIETAMQVKARCGYCAPAVVKKTKIGRRFVLGFHFEAGLIVGQKGKNSDGSEFEVLAIV